MQVGQRLCLCATDVVLVHCRFEMVWATSWGQDAPEFLGPLLGIGNDWSVLDFDLHTWSAICDLAAGRPFAWVDDDARSEALDLRDHCASTHLVVHTDHRVGLNDVGVARLLAFADMLIPDEATG